ncbi:hypothetical protein ACF0HT_13615 (plasmid) [Staphylococcus xylosus]|uniref:hypothetical protein n=1 Tax=Staphylococcus xylosus TaxID=1288 RepID=UPI003747FCA8
MTKQHENTRNNKLWKVITSILPILISVIALVFSGYTFYDMKIENKPNIKLVQNLWSNTPSFSLLNESTAKLDQVPYPTYLMYIPTKVYWNVQGKTQSNLALSPVSYDAIEEQTNGNEGTKATISKSKLPKEFKSKFGQKDLIKSKKVKLSKDIELHAETLPFLVIISPVEYKYRGGLKSKILLNTPNLSEDITEEDYKNIREYTKDNADLVVDFKKSKKKRESVYVTANKKIEEKLKSIEEQNHNKEKSLRFLGGKKGGYGSILKKLNEDISPIDPLEK